MGGTFAQPKVGRGAAFADVDTDGDLDVLITSNGGPVFLYRNDVARTGTSAVRFTLARDEVEPRRDRRPGPRLRRRPEVLAHGEDRVELPLAIGAAPHFRPRPSREGRSRVIEWPSGTGRSVPNLAAGQAYEFVEGKGITSEAVAREVGISRRHQPSGAGP